VKMTTPATARSEARLLRKLRLPLMAAAAVCACSNMWPGRNFVVTLPGDMKNGLAYKDETSGDPHVVISFQGKQMIGRGGGIMTAKVKNLVTGAYVDAKWNSGAKLEGVELQTVEAQFSYQDDDGYHFLNSETFEDMVLPLDAVDTKTGQFLGSGEDEQKTLLKVYNDQVLSFEVKNDFILEVVETKNKEDSREKKDCKIILENGVEMVGPYYLKVGDKVRICKKNFTIRERVQ